MKSIFILLVMALFSIELSGAELSKKSCENIKELCKAAGFTKNGHSEMKGLDADCFRPIIAGKTIQGVVVSMEELNACKNRIMKRKEKRQEVQSEAREKRLESNSAK